MEVNEGDDFECSNCWTHYKVVSQQRYVQSVGEYRNFLYVTVTRHAHPKARLLMGA